MSEPALPPIVFDQIRPVAETPPGLPLHFTGRAGEYFRIWIVNVALSVVTLGIYGAWAKVRTRQYFYGHTWLSGHNFAYTANPVAILKGHLIVGSLFALYVGSQYIGQAVDERFSWLTYGLLGLFFVLTPYLVFKSLRFLAANSVYRGLRFRFHGTLGGAYKVYLAWLLLVPPTLGLIFPYVVNLQRRYQMGQAAYGTARSRFTGEAGPVYLIYLAAVGVTFAGYLVMGAVMMAVLLPSILLSGGGKADPNTGLMIAAMVPVYALYLLLATGVHQGVRAALLNYSLAHTGVEGGVSFRSSVSPWLFGWIALSNLALQVVTLGLATPWAAVRRASYLTSNIAVVAPEGLEGFSADASTRDSALGESATELFGIEIGL